MKIFIVILGFLFVSSCSDPPGWTLWGHSYSGTAEEIKQDDWYSYDSYTKLADCKIQITALLADTIKHWEEAKADPLIQGGKLSVQSEKDAVKLTVTPPPTEKEKSPHTTTFRFFCVPFGIDPRPKDQSAWILWKETFIQRGGQVEHDWEPQDGYLTSSACKREEYFNTKLEQELEEQRQKKSSTAQISRRNYYHCFPPGVDPWGKHE